LFVAKYDRAIVLWVNTAFHNCSIVHNLSENVKSP